MTDYSITFVSNNNPEAKISGKISDNGELPIQLDQLVNYFRNNGIAVKAIGVSDWTSLEIYIEDDSYYYTR